MKLTLIRRYKEESYTIGKLYINGMYFCDTLEDTDRGLTSDMTLQEIRSKKVKHHTAIPTGSYEVLMVESTKYKKVMPRLKGVKGFSGILIHSGNTDKDTSGCILVGENLRVGKILNSKDIFHTLYAILKSVSAKEKITIEII